MGQWELALNTLLNVKHLGAKQEYTPSRHQSSVDDAPAHKLATLIERLTQLPQQVYRVKGFVRLQIVNDTFSSIR